MRRLGLQLFRMAVIASVAMLVLRLAGPKLRERMERMFEEAPDDFPPKWMHDNISAIRENTERILDALAREETEAGVS